MSRVPPQIFPKGLQRNVQKWHDKPSLSQSLKNNKKGIKKKRKCWEKGKPQNMFYLTSQTLETIYFIRVFNEDTIFVFKIQLKT